MREKGGLLLEVGRIHNRPSWEFATALHFTTVTASGNREVQMNQAEHTNPGNPPCDQVHVFGEVEIRGEVNG